MATFLGYSNFSGKNGDGLSADLLYDILEKNVAENYYKIRLYGYIRSWNKTAGSGSYCTFYINGQAAGGFSSITANQYSEVARLDVTVPGDELGNCVLNWSLYVKLIWTGGEASKSGIQPLEQIPRASIPTAGTQTIGQTLTINTNRKSTSFTHNLYYSFGGIGQTLIASGVGDNYSWTLPSTLYAQIPNSKSGTGTIYCDTYNGSTKIGDTQTCSFTALVNESESKPVVSLTVVDTNDKTIALTGNSSKLVKYYSTAKITASTVIKNGAGMGTVWVSGAGFQQSSTSTTYELSIQNVNDNTFNATAVDSRGINSDYVTITKDMVPYILLTCNDTLYRPTQTSSELKLKVSGNFFNGSFGKSTNALSLKYRYREKGASSYGAYTTITPTISNNTYSADISMGTNFNYQKAYDVEVVAEDLLDSKTATSSISQGIPIMWMGEDFIEVFGKQILIPYILYNNSSGNNGTVSLSDTVANYKYLEIYYNKSNVHDCTKIDNPNNKMIALFIDFMETNDYQQLVNSTFNIIDNTITYSGGLWSNFYRTGNLISADTIRAEIYITKVIGYK